MRAAPGGEARRPLRAALANGVVVKSLNVALTVLHAMVGSCTSLSCQDKSLCSTSQVKSRQARSKKARFLNVLMVGVPWRAVTIHVLF